MIPRFALRHPFLAALVSGPLLGLWLFVISGVSVAVAVGMGAAFALFMVIGWFPGVGPMRRWIERRYPEM